MKSLRNPVLMLTWGLPAIAVIASFASLALAMLSPDSELPEQYHWEGFRLDRDFDEAKRAADLDVRATLSGERAGVCRIDLSLRGPLPSALTLALTHSTKPALDQRYVFSRVSSSAAPDERAGIYETKCAPIPDAHWRVQLTDSAGKWSLRQYASGTFQTWTLHARAD